LRDDGETFLAVARTFDNAARVDQRFRHRST
jgi:hypothetical protein